ncbi:hypothetical protein GCM10007063_16750 [Lentibacillus kapialis]|uniref:Uncharacterized protein n=1 Tax=Lentibacillus kapialis TaxID=340214 RepID=A0A917UY31_9BACI|nr:hypothetical protein GCM10007063_16750 [Lentibacillus kapialis]
MLAYIMLGINSIAPSPLPKKRRTKPVNPIEKAIGTLSNTKPKNNTNINISVMSYSHSRFYA